MKQTHRASGSVLASTIRILHQYVLVWGLEIGGEFACLR
jgi:hypothetical protein